MLPDVYSPLWTSKAPLTWNVLIENVNLKRIVIYNIFSHNGFWKDCCDAVRKADGDKKAFEELIKTDLQYYFWSRCEWEIILTAWPPRSDFDGAKIDAYDQVMLNWEQFIDYLWNHRKELKK